MSPRVLTGRTAKALAATLLFLGSTLLVAPGLTPGASPHPTEFSTLILPGNGTIPINHIVIVMQENHVYDTYFGTYCQNVGAYCDQNGTGIPPGTCVPLYPENLSQGCQAPYLAAPSAVTAPVDLVHDWGPAHEAYDNGSMDGFYLAENHQLSTFLYYNGAEIPTYWDLAEEYGLGDNFFGSVLSYSTPNHWYLVAGGAPAQGINQSLSRGAIASTRLTPAEQTYLNEANSTPTIENLLANSSVSWKYYDYALPSYNQAINAPSGAGSQGSAFDFWNPLASQASSYTPTMKPHFVASSSFFTDAAAGNLPNVSWVLPSFNNSDHPSASIDNGESWVASIVNAVEQSKDWNSSAIFVTWDDYGGYYDNVPPPPLDADGLSFRAPLLVVSPYSREGYISHQFSYFESLLHLIEWRYHLPSLTARDANAPLPLDYFDFNATPRAPLHINPPGYALYPAPLQGLAAPRAPYGLTVTPGPASATLNWTLSGSGAPVTAYQLTYGPATDPTLSTVREDGSLTSVTISGLAPGLPYDLSLVSLAGPNSSAPATAVVYPGAGSTGTPPGQPATWTQLPSTLGTAPPARTGAGFVYDPADHADLLFGGQAANGSYLGDTWEYTDGQWVVVKALHPPPARAFAGMAYDSTDGYVLLFGGQGPHGYLGDTWKFLAGTWTNLSAGVKKAGQVPSARSYAAVTDNPSASSVLLFGGKGATGALGDTWHYVKGRWSTAPLKTAPSARWGAAITYDTKDGYPVLFGGNSSTGPLNDTWRLSASVWHPVSSLASPGPRFGATMVYDALDQYVLLFGGNRSGSLVTGTWRYVGGGWVLLTPTYSPSLRQYGSALFDSFHNGVVLGFGSGAAGPLYSLSEYGIPLSLGLTGSPGFGDAPILETFFPVANGGMGPYAYLWTLGDGSTSTLVEATHAYRLPGVYRVTLVVTDTMGAQVTASEYVTVDGPLMVTAVADPPGANGTVSFDSSVGGGDPPYQYAWVFGDGLPTGSTQANPTYQYTAPGTYLATVQVRDSGGESAVATAVTVTNGGPLPVSISPNTTTGPAPLAVGFNASGPNGSGPYTYRWAFGDGSLVSNLSSPHHSFTATGTYIVVANLTNSSGSWGTSFVVITVTAPLVVHAQAKPVTTGGGLAAAFQVNVSGGSAPYTVRWLFGDGHVSSDFAPTHQFPVAGTFTVMVTVADREGTRVDVPMTLSVSAPSAPIVAPPVVPPLAALASSGARTATASPVSTEVTPYGSDPAPSAACWSSAPPPRRPARGLSGSPRTPGSRAPR